MRKTKLNLAGFLLLFLSGFISCDSGPQNITLGKDACTFCKMGIADNRFGGEIITKKGKIYKFDDTHCILGFMKANTINNNDIKETWLVNYAEPHNFIAAEKATLLESSELHSPMGGNTGAFENQDKLNEIPNKLMGDKKIVAWDDLVKGNR
ncbi:MAG: nitrous oxide reductase accessory protein NosL [Ginsengibacter sp.]